MRFALSFAVLLWTMAPPEQSGEALLDGVLIERTLGHLWGIGR
jgi:hypothetical protein